MTYSELLLESDNDGLDVRDKPLQKHDGLIFNNRIAIRESIETRKERACVLAEEIGHYHTAAGDILDQSDSSKSRLEQRGRGYAYKLMCPLSQVADGICDGCRNIYELAEYLDVTEQFLIDAIEYYHQKYGLFVKLENRVISFEPLGVMKIMK